MSVSLTLYFPFAGSIVSNRAIAKSKHAVLPLPVGALITTFLSDLYSVGKALVCIKLKYVKGKSWRRPSGRAVDGESRGSDFKGKGSSSCMSPTLPGHRQREAPECTAQASIAECPFCLSTLIEVNLIGCAGASKLPGDLVTDSRLDRFPGQSSER